MRKVSGELTDFGLQSLTPGSRRAASVTCRIPLYAVIAASTASSSGVGGWVVLQVV